MTARPHNRLDQIAVAGTFSISVLSMELLRAHRADFWTGWTLQEASGALIATCFILMLILILTNVIARPLPLNSSKTSFCFAACIATMLCWAGLLPFWEALRISVVAIIILVNLAILTGLHIAMRLNNMTLRAACMSTITCLAALNAATVAAAYHYILDPNARIEQSPRIAFGWMAVIALLVAAHSFRPSRKKSSGLVGRVLLLGVAIVLPFLVAANSTQSTALPADADNPPILLITCDTLRADVATFAGGAVPMPNLEHLAASGVNFTRAYTLAPWTLPSVNGMFASLYPPGLTPGADYAQHTLEHTYYTVMAQELPTPFDSLRERGYDTTVLMGNSVLSRSKGIFRGFERNIVVPSSIDDRAGLFKHLPFLHDLLASVFPKLVFKRPIDSTRILTDMAVEFLQRHEGDRYVLWLHFMDPHTPYDPPAHQVKRDGPWVWFDSADPNRGGVEKGSGEIRRTFTSEEQDYIRSLYNAEVGDIDKAIGRVTEATPSGTYTLLVSDHGEEFWDHGQYIHGHQVYDELMRVPLILAGPGLVPATNNGLVSIIDVIPTMGEWLKLDPFAHWQGASLMSKVQGESTDLPIFARATDINAAEPLQMVVKGDYKLIRGQATGSLELYNLSTDPKELLNIAGSKSDIAQQLVEELDAWSEQHPDTFQKYWGDEGVIIEDTDVLDELKSLGYID